MQGKFIYVFNMNVRDRLLAANYKLLKADENQNIYVFENRETLIFSETSTEDLKFVISDTLTF